MKHRYVAAALFVLSLLLIFVGYLLYERPEIFGLCSSEEECFDHYLFYGVAKPLYRSIELLPPLFLVLIFVRREVFITWAKVAAVLFPIALWIIVSTLPFSGEFFPVFPTRPEMTELMVRLVVIASAITIALKYIRLSWKEGGT